MALSAVQAKTYIQLVQDLFREVGAAGKAPSTIVGTTGEANRLVNYVHDAELDIQNKWADWKWLRKTLTFYTKASSQTGIYTDNTGVTSAYPLDLAEWDYKSFFIYPAGSTTPQPFPTIEWQKVRNQVFDTVDTTQPWRVIVMPDNTLRFDMIPDQAYQCFCEYRSVPYDLKVDADVSNIPSRYANRLIVEAARMKYGLFENAPEQMERAQREIDGYIDEKGDRHIGLMQQLEADQRFNQKSSDINSGSEIVITTDYGGGYSSTYGYRGYDY